MAFRFIHTADVHLDSPLRTLALKDPELAELVANATRTTFTRIIDLCLSEKVDALIIAGDLYDGELTSMKTAAYFAAEMQRLVDADVRAFILRGNHDAESKITRHIELPAGVHVFSSRGDSVELEEHDVVLHGLSFAKPHVPDSLLTKYKPPRPDRINIGVLHTSLSGSPQHDPYSPCSVQELENQGYTYWALGHIHKRAVHRSKDSVIVMPGIPQGRHINESGPRSVTVVAIDDHQNVELDERVLCNVQFERLEVDLGDCVDWTEIGPRTSAALEHLVARQLADHLVVRMRLVGSSPLAGQLRREDEELRLEIQGRASALGSVWIEQIDNDVELPAGEDARRIDLSGPVAELRGIVANNLANDGQMIDLLRAELSDLQRALPAELREQLAPYFEDISVDDAKDTSEDLLRRAATDGAREVLAHLEILAESS